jgi:predicted transcriptional regulator
MEVVYRLGAPGAAEIAQQMVDPPSYSAVRAMLSILVGKGHLRHESDGARYLYRPTVSAQAAQKRALRDVVATFFQGSSKQALVALLDDAGKLSDKDIEEIRGRIDAAKTQGR